jgi:DNA-binding beta-propeller fold protein YncE
MGFARILATLCIALCMGAQGAAAKGLAFVLNSADATISVLDVSSQTELRRVPVLREPHHMALSPDGRSLLIGDTSGNSMFFMDPQTGEIQKRITVADPYQVMFSPDGKWLTVTGLARDQIDIYDATTMQLLHRIPIASMPSHLNYSPDSDTVFVSLQQTNRLVAITPATGKILWNAVVGNTPAGVLWHNGHVLVCLYGEADFAVVDPADGKVLRRVQTGRGAHNLFIPHDQSVMYVTNRVAGTISVMNPDTLDKIRDFRVPGGPDDIDFGPDGKMWTGLRWAHAVAIIDPATGTIVKRILVGRSPHGIWLNTHPDGLPVRVSTRAP